MTLRQVSDFDELIAVLEAPTTVGGDVVECLPGPVYIGTGTHRNIRKHNPGDDSRVTITNADPNNRVKILGSLTFEDCDGLTLENLDIEQAGFGNGQQCIRFKNCEHMKILDCDCRGGDHGLEMFGVIDLDVKENRFSFHGGDAMKYGGVDTFSIINNHDDGTRNLVDPTKHLDFLQTQGQMSNGVVRGNTFFGHDVPGKVVQGLFFDDFGHINMLVEQNIIYTNAGNGSQIDQADGLTFRHNTILGSNPNTTTRINPRDTVGELIIDLNIANAGAGPNGLNIPFEDYGQIYQGFDGTAKSRITIEDLRPVPGGPADFGNQLGAYERIAELLNIGGPQPMNTITIETNPTNGSVAVEADNQVTYTPNPGFTGNDQFSYRNTRDADGESDTALVDVEVRAPVEANNDNAVTLRDVPVTINVLQNDAG